jgi:hypothetical protein
VTEVEPRLEVAPGGDASALGCLRGPGSRPPGGTASGDVISTTRSLDIVNSRANELGLPGYPRVPPPHASWREVEGGVEQMHSQVVVVGRLLKETLDTVDRDVLQPARVSRKA